MTKAPRPAARGATWAAENPSSRKVTDLREAPGNARAHSEEQVSQIAAAIREWGWTIPVLVDDDNVILAGHARVRAARTLGLAEVPVIVAQGWSEEQKRAYLIADNKIAANSTWDLDALRRELVDLQSLGTHMPLLGFGAEELAALMPAEEAAPPPSSDDDSPADEIPPPPPPVTEPGDIWVLGGRHRLLCADASDVDAIAALMQGDQASLLFTSPPYGQQRDYTAGGISDWDAMMEGVFRACCAHVTPAGQVLVNLGMIHRDGEWSPYWDRWIDVMRADGWRRFGMYVWDQGPGLPGDWNGRLSPSYELVFHLNKIARQANKIVPCVWAGHVNSEKGGLRAKDGTVGEWTHAGQGVQDMRIPDNVLRITRHKARGMETEHPAVFPILLPKMIAETYSNPGEIILEPFCGSGSTIIGADLAGRVVYAVDRAPEYVDLAIARWLLNHPGSSVTSLADGRSYAAVAAARARQVRPPSRKRRDAAR